MPKHSNRRPWPNCWDETLLAEIDSLLEETEREREYVMSESSESQEFGDDAGEDDAYDASDPPVGEEETPEDG